MASHPPDKTKPLGARKSLPDGKRKKVETEPRNRKVELDQDDFAVVPPTDGLIHPSVEASPIAYAASGSFQVTAEHVAPVTAEAQHTPVTPTRASPYQPDFISPRDQNTPSASIHLPPQYPDPAVPQTPPVRSADDGDTPVQAPTDPTAQPLNSPGAAFPRPRRNQFPIAPQSLKYKHDKTPGKQNEYQANLRNYNEKVVCKIWGVSNFMDAIPQEIRPKRAMGNTALQYLFNLSGRVADLAKAQKLMRDEYAAHPKRDHTLGLIHLRSIVKLLKETSLAAEGGRMQDGDDDDDDQSDGESYLYEASRQEAETSQGRGVQTRGLSHPLVQGASPSDSLARQASRSLACVTAPPAALLSMADGMNILDIRPNRPAGMDTREAFPAFTEPVTQRHQGDGDRNSANMGVTKSLDSLASADDDEVWEAAAILMMMHADDAALRGAETQGVTGVKTAKKHGFEGDKKQEGTAKLLKKYA